MCGADISPIQWEVDGRLGEPVPVARTVHTCRRWEGVVEWAREHKG